MRVPEFSGTFPLLLACTVPLTMPKFASRFADYDHLARVKEWSKAGGAGEQPAGDAA